MGNLRSTTSSQHHTYELQPNNTTKTMRLVVLLLVAMTATAAPQSPESPQSSNLQSFISQLSGDDRPGEVNGDNEQVPYTTLQKFNGYEEREYPIIKWACTEETYPMEEPEEEGEE